MLDLTEAAVTIYRFREGHSYDPFYPVIAEIQSKKSYPCKLSTISQDRKLIVSLFNCVNNLKKAVKSDQASISSRLTQIEELKSQTDTKINQILNIFIQSEKLLPIPLRAVFTFWVKQSVSCETPSALLYSSEIAGAIPSSQISTSGISRVPDCLTEKVNTAPPSPIENQLVYSPLSPSCSSSFSYDTPLTAASTDSDNLPDEMLLLIIFETIKNAKWSDIVNLMLVNKGFYRLVKSPEVARYLHNSHPIRQIGFTVDPSLNYLEKLRIGDKQEKLSRSPLHQFFPHKSTIETLKIHSCERFDDVSCYLIAQSYPKLKKLTFINCPKVSDVGLTAILTNCQELEELTLMQRLPLKKYSKVEPLTDMFLASLRLSQTKLKKLHIMASNTFTLFGISLALNVIGKHLQDFKFVVDQTNQINPRMLNQYIAMYAPQICPK